jgi:hypothetical protein
MKVMMYEKVMRVSYVEAARKIGIIRKDQVIPSLVARDTEDVYLKMEKWLQENGIERAAVRVRSGFVPIKCRAKVDLPKSLFSQHSLAIL